MVTDDEVIYDQTFTLNLLESPNNKKLFAIQILKNKKKKNNYYSGMRTYTFWITIPAFYKMNSNVCSVK